MSHPDDEALVDLAITGPDAADPSAAVRTHLATCVTCSNSVSELRRTLTLTGRGRSDAVWVDPPASLWSRIAAEIDAPETAPAAARPHVSDRAVAPASGTSSDNPSDNPADPGEPTPEPSELRSARRQREGNRRSRLVAGAAGIAAAGLVVGLLTGRALWNDPAAPAATTVSQVALDTLDASDPQRLGEAAVVRTGNGYALTVDTAKPLDAGDGYLEVWLINRDLKRMVSVGVLDGGATASFPISQALIDQGYVVVDISREHFDDQPAHSGDSVVRGKLPA